jgi:hypothetical protein
MSLHKNGGEWVMGLEPGLYHFLCLHSLPAPLPDALWRRQARHLAAHPKAVLEAPDRGQDHYTL